MHSFEYARWCSLCCESLLLVHYTTVSFVSALIIYIWDIHHPSFFISLLKDLGCKARNITFSRIVFVREGLAISCLVIIHTVSSHVRNYKCLKTQCNTLIFLFTVYCIQKHKLPKKKKKKKMKCPKLANYQPGTFFFFFAKPNPRVVI